MQSALEKLPAWLLIIAGFLMVALLGWIDYLTGDYSMLIYDGKAEPIKLELFIDWR